MPHQPLRRDVQVSYALGGMEDQRKTKRPAGKRLRDWLVYRFSRLLLLVGRVLPPSFGYYFGGGMGRLGHALDKRDRERARANLHIAFPDKDERWIERTARDSFRHLGRLLIEVLRIPRLKTGNLDKTIRFEGVEIVKEAVKSGRGVVIATGHIGNWEVMGAATAQLGLPLNVIARRLNDERLNRMVIDLRASAGVRTILRESADSAKEILRALRRGEMLALLIDQDIDVEGTFVEFFGCPAWTSTGAAALALRTGALFVTAAAQRTAPGRHLVRVREVEIDVDAPRERAIIDATQRATRQLEEWIRQCPEQWAWLHQRWRRQEEQPEPKQD